MPKKIYTDEDFNTTYPLVGEYIGPKTIAFELRVYDWVDKTDIGYGLPVFDPAAYFITSGDCVHKSKYMLEVLENALDNENADKSAVKKAISQVENLIAALRRSKGDAVHMELDRKDGKLIVVAKNPRPRPLASTQSQKQYKQY